jgi:hypothetical protein
MMSDTSNAESGSDVDDFGSSYIPKGSDYGCLTPVHEEVSSVPNSNLFLLALLDLFYSALYSIMLGLQQLFFRILCNDTFYEFNQYQSL